MSSSNSFNDFCARLRPLVERQIETAAELRQLMKEGREIGIEGGVLKAWIKAMIDYEDTGKETSLKRLQERTKNAAIYAEALGVAIDGFGKSAPKSKRLIVNKSPARTLDDIPIVGAHLTPPIVSEEFEEIPPQFDRRPKVAA